MHRSSAATSAPARATRRRSTDFGDEDSARPLRPAQREAHHPLGQERLRLEPAHAAGAARGARARARASCSSIRCTTAPRELVRRASCSRGPAATSRSRWRRRACCSSAGGSTPTPPAYCDHLDEFRALAMLAHRRRVVRRRRRAVEPRRDDIARALGPGKPARSSSAGAWGGAANGAAIVRALDALGAISGNLGIAGRRRLVLLQAPRRVRHSLRRSARARRRARCCEPLLRARGARGAGPADPRGVDHRGQPGGDAAGLEHGRARARDARARGGGRLVPDRHRAARHAGAARRRRCSRPTICSARTATTTSASRGPWWRRPAGCGPISRSCRRSRARRARASGSRATRARMEGSAFCAEARGARRDAGGARGGSGAEPAARRRCCSRTAGSRRRAAR